MLFGGACLDLPASGFIGTFWLSISSSIELESISKQKIDILSDNTYEVGQIFLTINDSKIR